MRLLTQTPRVTRRDFQKQHAAPSHGRSRGLTVATGFRVLERKGALVLHGLCRLFWTSTRVFTPFLGPREQCAWDAEGSEVSPRGLTVHAQHWGTCPVLYSCRAEPVLSPSLPA